MTGMRSRSWGAHCLGRPCREIKNGWGRAGMSNRSGLRRGYSARSGDGRSPEWRLESPSPVADSARPERPLIGRTGLAPPSDRPIARERPGPHSQARPERRRHVVQRRTAVAANVQRSRLHPQPVAARGTFWIQTLYCPAGQILHGCSCLAKRRAPATKGGSGRRRGLSSREALQPKWILRQRP
jgi:hypothetical protein